MIRRSSGKSQRKPALGHSVLVVLLVLVMAACTSTTSPDAAHKSCTAIGAYSGVDVRLEPGLLPPASKSAVVTACVDGACVTNTYTAPFDSTFFFPMSSVVSGKVTVSVTLTADDHRLFAGTSKVQTVKFQPNGPGCDPTVWQARVTARANGQLTG